MKTFGKVLFQGHLAGKLERTPDRRYRFTYSPEYLASPSARAVSLTLPLRQKPYESPHLFSFFSGLLAEGSLKEMQCRILKIDPNDEYTRLLKTAGGDVIGAVTVEEAQE